MVFSAIVICAERTSNPSLARTVTVMSAEPVPDAGVSVTQLDPAVAVHEQPAVVST
jgi:hypothetical protein